MILRDGLVLFQILRFFESGRFHYSLRARRITDTKSPQIEQKFAVSNKTSVEKCIRGCSLVVNRCILHTIDEVHKEEQQHEPATMKKDEKAKEPNITSSACPQKGSEDEHEQHIDAMHVCNNPQKSTKAAMKIHRSRRTVLSRAEPDESTVIRIMTRGHEGRRGGRGRKIEDDDDDLVTRSMMLLAKLPKKQKRRDKITAIPHDDHDDEKDNVSVASSSRRRVVRFDLSRNHSYRTLDSDNFDLWYSLPELIEMRLNCRQYVRNMRRLHGDILRDDDKVNHNYVKVKASLTRSSVRRKNVAMNHLPPQLQRVPYHGVGDHPPQLLPMNRKTTDGMLFLLDASELINTV